MRGHIRKRGKDSWALVYDAPRNPENGSRNRKWVTVHGTKKHAELQLSKLLADIDSGRFADDDGLTIGELLNRWLRDHRIRIRETTFAKYEWIARRQLAPLLGHIRLRDLTPANVSDAIAYWREDGRINRPGGLSPQSVRQNFRILKLALGYALRLNLVARNVADVIQAPPAPRILPRALTKEQVIAILDAGEDSDVARFFEFSVLTGLPH